MDLFMYVLFPIQDRICLDFCQYLILKVADNEASEVSHHWHGPLELHRRQAGPGLVRLGRHLRHVGQGDIPTPARPHQPGGKGGLEGRLVETGERTPGICRLELGGGNRHFFALGICVLAQIEAYKYLTDLATK